MIDGHRPRLRLWMLLVVVGIIALMAHSAVLYAVLSHAGWSAGAVAGTLILVVMKHLGSLSRLSTVFRRRSRP